METQVINDNKAEQLPADLQPSTLTAIDAVRLLETVYDSSNDLICPCTEFAQGQLTIGKRQGFYNWSCTPNGCVMNCKSKAIGERAKIPQGFDRLISIFYKMREKAHYGIDQPICLVPDRETVDAFLKLGILATCTQSPDLETTKKAFKKHYQGSEVYLIHGKGDAEKKLADDLAGAIKEYTHILGAVELDTPTAADFFAMGGTKDQLCEQLGKVKIIKDNGRATTAKEMEGAISGDAIILPSAHTEYSASARSIFEKMKAKKTAFCRGGKVYEVAKTGSAMQLEPLSATALKSRLERHGKTFVYTNVRGKVALVPKLPSTEACDTILESLEAQEILDPISNIFRNPIIIKNGDSVKVLGSGWHPDNGGVFVAGQTAIPDVPFAEAKDRLMSLMDDFLFVQESDKTRMLSAIISPALRFGGFIGGNCPLHAFEATESQTGKGYACEIIEAVYNEPPSIVAIKNGGVGSFDESLSERLSQGRPLIRFDNLRGKLDSQFLEMVITAPGAVGLRIPHRGEIHADVKHFFFLATSNGLESTEDLANRCCIIRLRKQAQGYKFKTFADGRDLISHVKKNSALYLGSIFSIVKEWAFAKFPEESRYHHDFREWHGKVEGLIKLAWPSTAPLMAQHMEALLRTSNPALSWARKLCSVIDRQGQLDKILYASAIAELCQEDDIEIPGLRVGADSYAAKKQVGLLLAKVHRLGETVALDEYQITKSEEKKPRDDGKGFYAQKTYTFAKQGQNHPLPENEAKPEILSKSPVSPSKSTKDSGNSSFSMKDVTPYWETPRLTGEPSKPVISGVPQELLTAGNDRRPRQDLF